MEGTEDIKSLKKYTKTLTVLVGDNNKIRQHLNNYHKKIKIFRPTLYPNLTCKHNIIKIVVSCYKYSPIKI